VITLNSFKILLSIFAAAIIYLKVFSKLLLVIKTFRLKKNIQHFIVAAIVSLSIIACSKSETNNSGILPTPAPEDECASTPASFSADVNPIIQSNCAIGSGCHGDGSSNGPGALTTFEQIKAAASSIRSAVTSKRMPLGRTLTAAQIKSISCWVDNNATNN
jgi:hypothetical protein